MNITLGSLFDGIGGFPYSGIKFGITPVWASEIEPWPIKVTEKHFPNMKHLGDITEISGAEIEPVDVITFGSPCQDLSVAGKREGLAGERSGLFMDAIRIIRQMRTATGGKCPRFAVWENVPGAFSSNKGEDFRAVLEEITETEIPMPASGKWATAGMVRTGNRDVAWRTLDAQHWGVPQRRKRIFLVADFRGRCAGEILFESSCLRGDSAESGEAQKEAAATVGDGIKTAVPINTQIATRHNALGERTGLGIGKQGDPAFTLQESHSHEIFTEVAQCVTTGTGRRFDSETETLVLEPIPIHDKATRYKGGGDTRNNDGAANGFGVGKPGDVMPTLGTADRHAVAYGIDQQGDNNVPVFLQTQTFRMKAFGDYAEDDTASTVKARDGKDATDLVCTVDCRNLCENVELSGTSQAKENGGYSLNYQNPVRVGYAVRRLTPLECLRLQGFPDYWLDIDGMSDTQKYKAVGNSVAIPCVKFVLGGIARVLQT